MHLLCLVRHHNNTVEACDSQFFSLHLSQLQKEETVLPREWDTPAEEEREEDLREDEKVARWEAQTAAQFLPPAMIVRPFQRPRPVIVCLSRDVPAAAKQNIISRLQHHLAGVILHIDKQTDMGLHVRDLQQALSARCGGRLQRLCADA